MRALTIPRDNPQNISLRSDYPMPSPPSGEVLVRVRLAGICSTDLELARGYMGFLGVLGHEFVGIVETGPENLVGRRVVAEINCACGACDMCERGLPTHCTERTVLGIAGRDGVFADYTVVPAANCHLVPDQISDEQAVFVEPLAAAAHVLDAATFDTGTRVALLGTGRLGLLTAQVLAQTDAELIVVGRNRQTLGLCAQWGLRTVRLDAVRREAVHDVVVDCTGHPDGLRLAMALCRPCGTIVLKSTYADPEAIDLAPIVIHEIRVVGSRCGDFSRAIQLLADGKIAVDDLVSAVYPMHDAEAAFAAAGAPENIKVLIRPEGD